LKFEEVRGLVDGVPFMKPDQAQILYDFILQKQPRDCLELGFAHGVSVCYTAAALQELGRGHLTAVDLTISREWQQPSIEELLDKTGLGSSVTVVREPTSYTWFLKRKLEAASDDSGVYDFCYIDGSKNWTIDGLAFFVVDKLLRQDGWILFDDFTWTYARSSEESRQRLEEAGIFVGRMGDDELSAPQVEAIFRLLVMKHPDYAEFITRGDWAWAHKIESSRRTLAVEETMSLRTALVRGFRRIGRLATRAPPPASGPSRSTPAR
jgi:predicted O-methyltransferase YrrM